MGKPAQRVIVKAQKITERQINHVKSLGYGNEEPAIPRETMNNIQLLRAYSWYGAMKDNDDALKYLKDFYKSHPFVLRALDKVEINKTLAWMARLLTRGAILSSSDHRKMSVYTQQLEQIGRIVQDQPRGSSEKQAVDKLDLYLPTFEDAIDQLDGDFDPHQYLESHSVGQIFVIRIRQYYQPKLDEMIHVVEGSDPELVEGYKHLNAVDQKILRDYYLKIVNACNAYLEDAKNKKTARKPRQKSDQQILKHFKCCDRYEPLGVVSIPPSQVLGCSELYVYNTSNNVLTAFIAKEGGLGVHRSSITNFDEKLTSSKRVGKRFKSAFELISKGSKKERATIMDTLITEAVRTSDRINTNVVLLKAYR